MFGRASAFDRGLDAFERGDWKRARRLLEEALAGQESAVGFYHLGLLYWRGLGGETSKRDAADCFARAAEAGHPGAQTAYGIALRSGVGAEQNADAARTQFRAAAGAGDCAAMVELAALGESGEKKRWLLRASELGHPPAMRLLADLLMNEDPIEALSWLYAGAALSGDDSTRKRAAALAREMSAAEIDAAQKAGRAYAKDISQRARERRR